MVVTIGIEYKNSCSVVYIYHACAIYIYIKSLPVFCSSLVCFVMFVFALSCWWLQTSLQEVLNWIELQGRGKWKCGNRSTEMEVQKPKMEVIIRRKAKVFSALLTHRCVCLGFVAKRWLFPAMWGPDLGLQRASLSISQTHVTNGKVSILVHDCKWNWSCPFLFLGCNFKKVACGLDATLNTSRFCCITHPSYDYLHCTRPY